MAKSTLVSVLPFALNEEKPGLVPSLYVVPSAPKGGFSVLVVKDGFHNVLIPLSDDKAPPMRITDTSEVICKSLIDDYIAGCLAVDYTPNERGAIALPGLFWVEGEKTKISIQTEHKPKIEQAILNTKMWFERLVKLADDDWSRYHMHRSITDLQRSACKYLELEREWNFDVMSNTAILCWSCKAGLHPEAIICGGCKAIINMDEYNKRKAQFVA